MNLNYKKLTFFTILILLILLIFLYKTYIEKLIILRHKYSNTSINKVIITYNKFKDNLLYYNMEKKNIIFFFSIDYNILPKYYNKSLEIYKHYCNLHGYSFLVIDHTKDKNKISPYWNRVSDFVKLSNKFDSNTILIYIDVDTCVNPKYSNISIENFLNSIDIINNKSSDIYIGNDLNNSINAGIIIVRNTNWSKQFLNLWWSKYNPQDWNFKNNKWTCKQNGKLCDWAKNGYEEGSFSLLYENNELNSQKYINVLHYSLISNHLTYDDGFIFHFYIRSDYYKTLQINKFYNKYFN